MEEMTGTFSKVLGNPLKYVEQSDEDFIEDMLRFDIPKYAAEGFVETYKYVRAGDFAHCTDYVRVMGINQGHLNHGAKKIKALSSKYQLHAFYKKTLFPDRRPSNAFRVVRPLR